MSHFNLLHHLHNFLFQWCHEIILSWRIEWNNLLWYQHLRWLWFKCIVNQ